MAELVGDHVGRLGNAEAVDVDAASGFGIALREVAFTNSCADGFRIVG
jgi:hypothetical protein